MRIYTKFGDKGTTALIGGATVPKNDLRVQAYGDVDELNSLLGVVLAFGDDGLKQSLTRVQKDLFSIGAWLATKGAKARGIPPARIGELEAEIDSLSEKLPPLKHFILPGGSKTASTLHHARAVCRRAERSIVSLSQKESVRADIITYMNRLGDLLFMQARHANYRKKVPETVWKGR